MYEKRIVAFLDILGISAAIKASDSDVEKQKTLVEMYRNIRAIDLSFFPELKAIATITSFSDSIVVSAPYNKEIIPHFLHYIRLIQSYFTHKSSYFVRGGIAMGALFHENDIVLGNPYLEAHKLESELAIYPRIIMDENTANEILEELKDTDMSGIKKDIDGFYYLDYIAGTYEFLHLYNGLRNKATQNIEKTRDNKKIDKITKQKIKQKMDWVLAKIAELNK